MEAVTKFCVLCRTPIPLNHFQCCDACVAHPTTREETETMASKKTGSRRTSRRPAKKAPRKPKSRKPKPPPSPRDEGFEEDEDDEDDSDSEETETRERKPRKPKQELERASMFAVVRTIELDDENTKDEIVDVFYDEGSAGIVAQSIGNDDEAFVDPVEVLLIKTKIPGTRGKFDVAAHVLDRAAAQPLKPEASEFAGAALTRKRALAKLTPEERAALGLPANVGGGDEPARKMRDPGTGTASNPAEPETSGDEADEHTDDDEAPDPFA